MSQVAAQRLIDAAAGLEPAERALLNLWVNRGLDDDTIARLTHANVSAIAARRSELVGSLSTIIGLPPTTVHESLDELATSARDHLARPRPTSTEGVEVALKPRRPRRRLVAIAIGIVLIIVVVVLALTLSGSAQHHRSAVSAAKATATSPSAPAPHQGSTLIGLPGGPAGVTGTVAIVGPRARPQLELTVRGLPMRAGGYYELWLYNSILDADPIARLSAPASSEVIALPGDRSRYRWLDISFQPSGAPRHSGESILRAAVPT